MKIIENMKRTISTAILIFSILFWVICLNFSN